MDMPLEKTDKEKSSAQSRKWAVSKGIILFLFLHILQDGNEGGVGLENLSWKVGLGVFTPPNHFRHIAMAHVIVLKDEKNVVVQRPICAKRESVHGSVWGFSKYVALVDGTKQKIFSPEDDKIQKETYRGQHHVNDAVRISLVWLFVWTSLCQNIVMIEEFIINVKFVGVLRRFLMTRSM